MSESYDTVVAALTERGATSKDVRPNRSMWQCPAHPDNNPSLEVKYKDGKTILACYAGCHTDDVVTALGLRMSDLFDGELSPNVRVKETLVRSYLYETRWGAPYFYVDRYFPKTFRQRMPGVEPARDLGDRQSVRDLGLARDMPPVVYHYPRVLRSLKQEPTEVWWLDGEKDVETAEKHGLVATCAPGFAKWDPRYASELKGAGATGVVIVVDQDKEKPDGTLGAGQQAAVKARLGFRSVGLPVRVVSPCMGKDLTDHFAAGCTVDDFQPDPSLVIRPRGLTAAALMQATFDPVVWAVEGVIPTGLTILAGAPKCGKSWVSLDVAAAVAAGGRALGGLRVAQGSVLYLAREDTYRRLQSRLRLLMGGADDIPKGLEVVPNEVEWVGGEEGLANMTEWADEQGDARMVILDTLAKVEPEMGEDGRRGAYSGNYSMMARYKNWADLHNCSVVMVHHDNKTKPDKTDGWMDDPFTAISGTRAITGAADTVLFLETKRFSDEGRLHITGRDVGEQSVEMKKHGPLWNVFGIVKGVTD